MKECIDTDGKGYAATGGKSGSVTGYMLAEIFDMGPSHDFGHEVGTPEWEEHYDKPYHIKFDDVWLHRPFFRRCDASRFARLRAERIIHWYAI